MICRQRKGAGIACEAVYTVVVHGSLQGTRKLLQRSINKRLQFGKGVSGLKQPIIFPWQKLFVHRVWLKALLKPKTCFVCCDTGARRRRGLDSSTSQKASIAALRGSASDGAAPRTARALPAASGALGERCWEQLRLQTGARRASGRGLTKR